MLSYIIEDGVTALFTEVHFLIVYGSVKERGPNG